MTELKIDIKKAAYRNRVVLKNVRFTAEPGSFTAVIGRNGCGKSTLISCIAGLMPFDGIITADGVDPAALTGRERALKMSVMLQMMRAPHVPVEDFVAFGRTPYHAMGDGGLTAEDREKIGYAIREAELEDMRLLYADRISGGEQRRAYFGMMLAQDAPVMLLDESTAFMDADHESRLLGKIAALKGKKTVVAVMHSLENALRYADQIILLDEGSLRFAGTADEILATELIEEIFHVRRYTAADCDGRSAIFFRGRE